MMTTEVKISELTLDTQTLMQEGLKHPEKVIEGRRRRQRERDEQARREDEQRGWI